MELLGIRVRGVYHGLKAYAFDSSGGAIEIVRRDLATEVVGDFQSDPPTLPISTTLTYEPVWVTKPVVAGIPEVGQTLTTPNGTWDDMGDPITEYRYNWYVCGSDFYEVRCTPLGVNSNQYTVRPEDTGFYIRSEVSARNSYGWGAGAKSEATAHVPGDPHPSSSWQRALCHAYTPNCVNLRPDQIISKMRTEAQAYNFDNYGYGFDGDPYRAVPPTPTAPDGKYFGFLINAGLY